jgi:hypothetical protein
MSHQPSERDYRETGRGKTLASRLLDALVELTLRRDLDGLRRPCLVQGAGSPLRLHGAGISACPACGGPRRVHRLGEQGKSAAPHSHFCARCWQLDLVDRDGTVCGRANRRLEKLVREMPVGARPSSVTDPIRRS